MSKKSFPSTLYLPDRVNLAMESLVRIVDKESGLPFCLFDILSSPPKLAHTCFDWSDHTARVIDALLLGKAMTGTTSGDETISSLERILDNGFGIDGLHYTPENEWTSEQANMHYQRSVINALLSKILVHASDSAKDRLQKLLKELCQISVKRDHFWYFPAVEYLRNGWFRGDWDILGYGVDPANTNGRLIFGLCKAYELLKDDESARLAENYANHVMYHSSAYMADGSFATGMEFREGHFHSRAVTMLGVIKYGYTFNNKAALEWGKKVFDKSRTYGSSFGWFPERLIKERAHGAETCAIVDMMEAAIWLALGGYTEYWEVAETYLRNQLVESQLISMNALLTARRRRNANDETSTAELLPFIGGFSGWSMPNDLLAKVMHSWDLYLCCCAQGIRGMFNAWTHAVTKEEEITTVNFLINYGDSEVTVKSWLPDEGRIEFISERSTLLKVRIPDWVEHKTINVTCSEENVDFKITDHYLEVKNLHAGDKLEIKFVAPVFEKTERILDVDYITTWKGNTVTGIKPEGELIPLYNHRNKNRETTVLEKDIIDIPFLL